MQTAAAVAVAAESRQKLFHAQLARGLLMYRRTASVAWKSDYLAADTTDAAK